MPPKYRSRTPDVEAIQLLSDNIKMVAEWCGGVEIDGVCIDVPAIRKKINRANISDYIIKSIRGNFSVMPERKFEGIYKLIKKEVSHVENELINKARKIVFDYVKSEQKTTINHSTFAMDEVIVVWFSKTLQNWKAMVTSTLPYGMYYEVTHNGTKSETYLDVYTKLDNIVIPD